MQTHPHLAVARGQQCRIEMVASVEMPRIAEMINSAETSGAYARHLFPKGTLGDPGQLHGCPILYQTVTERLSKSCHG